MLKNVLITQFNEGVMNITQVDWHLCFVGIYIRKILGLVRNIYLIRETCSNGSCSGIALDETVESVKSSPNECWKTHLTPGNGTLQRTTLISATINAPPPPWHFHLTKICGSSLFSGRGQIHGSHMVSGPSCLDVGPMPSCLQCGMSLNITSLNICIFIFS